MAPIIQPIIDTYEALNNWPPPPGGRLYHYTSMGAFHEIITSGTLRATHRSYLNDRADLEYGLKACCRFLQKWVEQHEGWQKRLGEEVLRKIEAEINDAAKSPFSFAASFTENGDGAAQWQIYTPSGRGVAIAFDFVELRNSLQRAEFSRKSDGHIVAPHFVLSKIEYDKEIQEEQVVRLMESASECWPAAEQFYKSYKCPEERIGYSLAHFLWQLATRTFKHGGHFFDQEWKATPHVAGDEFIKLHATRNAIRPYIEMRFDLSCIESVVVGSAVQQHFDDVRQTLKLLLAKHHLEEVEIQKSEVLLAPPEE